MKFGVAQINTIVGDIDGNEKKIAEAYRKGVERGVDLVVTPELALTGYPPRDLLLKKSLVHKNIEALQRLAEQTGECGLVVGYVGNNEHLPGRETTNALALLHRGKIIAVRTKTLLPT